MASGLEKTALQTSILQFSEMRASFLILTTGELLDLTSTVLVHYTPLWENLNASLMLSHFWTLKQQDFDWETKKRDWTPNLSFQIKINVLFHLLTDVLCDVFIFSEGR